MKLVKRIAKQLASFATAGLLALTLLASTPALAAAPGTIPAVPNLDQRYQPILTELQMTGIPLRLPTYAPATTTIRSRDPKVTAETLKMPVFVHLNEDTPNGYIITLGYSETCDGGNSCRLGTLSAQRLTKGTPSIDEQYAFMKSGAQFKGKRSQELMATVSLTQGVKGQFIPWICGANCNDAKVVWDQDGYRYFVGIKVGDKGSLVQMANSAIESTIGQVTKPQH
jgi:hypothetical protein